MGWVKSRGAFVARRRLPAGRCAPVRVTIEMTVRRGYDQLAGVLAGDEDAMEKHVLRHFAPGPDAERVRRDLDAERRGASVRGGRLVRRLEFEADAGGGAPLDACFLGDVHQHNEYGDAEHEEAAGRASSS